MLGVQNLPFDVRTERHGRTPTSCTSANQVRSEDLWADSWEVLADRGIGKTSMLVRDETVRMRRKG